MIAKSVDISSVLVFHSNNSREHFMSDIVASVDDAGFEQMVSNSELPIVVDFWAEWCGPCKMIAPIFSAVAKSYKGKVTMVKMNVDECTTTPAKYGVRSIPTLLLLKGGEVVGTKVGALTQSQLSAFIDEHC